MMFCCLRGCLGGGVLPPRAPPSPVQLDTLHMGHEVVVVKGGRRVCGSGCALATAPLVQSKSYFEVKLQQGGVWAVGLATRAADLDRVHGGIDAESWCLNHDGTVRHNNVELHRLPQPPAEGDTLGVAYDHIDLNFFLNGKTMDVPVANVKGQVYPALYVDDGAILDLILDNFLFPPPVGFDKIMIEQSLL